MYSKHSASKRGMAIGVSQVVLALVFSIVLSELSVKNWLGFSQEQTHGLLLSLALQTQTNALGSLISVRRQAQVQCAITQMDRTHAYADLVTMVMAYKQVKYLEDKMEPPVQVRFQQTVCR